MVSTVASQQERNRLNPSWVLTVWILHACIFSEHFGFFLQFKNMRPSMICDSKCPLKERESMCSPVMDKHIAQDVPYLCPEVAGKDDLAQDKVDAGCRSLNNGWIVFPISKWMEIQCISCMKTLVKFEK